MLNGLLLIWCYLTPPLQALNSSMVGQVQDFQTVPGCGLRCRVTHLCNMMDPDQCDADIIARRSSTSSFDVAIDGGDDDRYSLYQV